MKHVILKTTWCNRMENGMLRDLERAIAAATGGELVEHPEPMLPNFLNKRLQRGTRYEPLRRFAPHRAFAPKADVLWVPLQAPEDFQLDMFKGWERSSKVRVLYLFDTFPHQYRLSADLAKRWKWDLLITSFADAVPHLEKASGRKWHVVEQGVDLSRFYPRAFSAAPPIFACSYGRRIEDFHRELLAWSLSHRAWYDYMASISTFLRIPTEDHYEIFANHVGSSYFSVCWPMEKSHPKRAGHLSPVTCRWFEVAAAASIPIGEAPRNPTFESWFGKDFVQPVPADPSRWGRWLDELAERAPELRKVALERREKMKDMWTWQARVRKMLDLLGEKAGR